MQNLYSWEDDEMKSLKSLEDFEFMIPKYEIGSQNFECHKKRYDFAIPFCEDKVVLDIACGTGYGATILEMATKFVIGVDKSMEAIKYANQYYKTKDNQFILSDAIEYLEKNKDYDIIICFETLEHLDDKEFVFLIKKDVPIIFSVPYNEKELTRWHKKRYKEEDLIKLFEGRKIEFWYQHKKGKIDKNNKNVQNIIGVIND